MRAEQRATDSAGEVAVMSKTRFKVVQENVELRDAIAPALKAAETAAKKGIAHRGVVIAQFYQHDDGRVEIRGDFIESEYAVPIFEALRQRESK